MILLATALVPLIALSAFFSGAETVLFSLTGAQRSRIARRSPAAERRISKCLADKAVLFSTLLVGNTFVNFAISAIGYMALSAAVPGYGWLSVPIMTVILLFFGEITPKRLALRHAEAIAPHCASLLLFWRTALAPFSAFFKLSSRAFSPMLERERRALSDAELVSVMENAAEHGEMSSSDVDMIEGVLRLSELCANDEMTPRVDIEGYDIDRPPEYLAECVRNARHRHLPAYRRTPDAIEGVFDVAEGRMEEALFVPETVTLDDLLVTFAKSGKSLAVVLDEYGGTAGIITVNDVMELIVGPAVYGEGRGDEPRIAQVAGGVWEIDARASLDEINRTVGVELEAEDADRLSGWMQFHAERIPHLGQSILADGCRATVLKRRRRRVTLVRLEVLERPEADTDEELLAAADEAVEKTEEDNA